MMKLLFLLRKNNSYNTEYSNIYVKSGLINSVKLTIRELEEHLDVRAKVEVCLDSNEINKYVTKYKPDICFLEALWVPPYKYKQLIALHPNVTFVNRIHSEIPFLANEGIAIDWIKEYDKIPTLHTSFNSKSTARDFSHIISNSSYLPNLYPADRARIFGFEDAYYLLTRGVVDKLLRPWRGTFINVGCFGAIRPLKNQLIQAFAAMEMANDISATLQFHINYSRTEQGGNSVLKNIRALFSGTRHKLIEHEWLGRQDFLVLANKMDVGMQTSFSETFNIVTADLVSVGVPVVVSDTISWMPEIAIVDEESVRDIKQKLKEMLVFPRYFSKKSKQALYDYNQEAINIWRKALNQ